MLPNPTSRRVGTELARLLDWFPKLVPWWNAADCDCWFWRKQMDEKGPDWCEQNVKYIAKEIGKGARRAGIWTPFMRPVLEGLVRHAIWRARNPVVRYNRIRRRQQKQEVQ